MVYLHLASSECIVYIIAESNMIGFSKLDYTVNMGYSYIRVSEENVIREITYGVWI